MAYRANDGTIHHTEDEARAHNTTLDNGIMGANTLGKGMGIGAIIALIIPIIVAGLFELLFRLSFKLKLVGRIIQSALVGTVLGVLIVAGVELIFFYSLGKYPAPPNFFTRFLIIAVVSGLPAFGYYFSHYFSLKAAMYDERFSKGDNMFLVPFAIALYGIIALLIINAIIKGFTSNSLPQIIYAVPVIVAAVWYFVKIMAVREGAKQIKKEEGMPIVGLPVAVVAAFILPMMLLSSMADKWYFYTDEAEVERSANRMSEEAFIEQTKNAAVQNFAVVVTAREGRILDEPRYDGTIIKRVRRNTVLTVTGEAIKTGLIYCVPIEYEGDKGYALLDDLL
ncbi:MAG: hypothetical protein FWB86_13820 [Treponema sp.]|nr:hypothetical protein [Treponema sp.]